MLALSQQSYLSITKLPDEISTAHSHPPPTCLNVMLLTSPLIALRACQPLPPCPSTSPEDQHRLAGRFHNDLVDVANPDYIDICSCNTDAFSAITSTGLPTSSSQPTARPVHSLADLHDIPRHGGRERGGDASVAASKTSAEVEQGREGGDVSLV
eukprot:759825-Hanusia_phi.AAC.14